MATVKVDPNIITKYMQHNGMAMTQKNIDYFVKQFSTKPVAYSSMVKKFGGEATAPKSEPDKATIIKYATAFHGKKPTAAQVATMMNYYSSDMSKYQTEVVDALANNVFDPVKVTPVKKAVAKPKAKPATFIAQLKTIGPITKGKIKLDSEDMDVARLLAAVRDRLKKKNSTYTATFKQNWEGVTNGAMNQTDQVSYLEKVLALLDPTYKPGEIIKDLQPGQYYELPVPNDIALSKYAKSKMPAAGAAAKADALTKKIAAFEEEIARLKKKQEALDKQKQAAKVARKKLDGMNPKLVKYFAYIEQHCGEFLKSVASTNKFLYRGQGDAAAPVFVGYPRADRIPKDSDADAQQLMDKYLNLAGFKALRSNSIFTSANYSQAGNYGTVYAIFPKDGFNFTWSTVHDDIVLHTTQEVLGISNTGNTKLYSEVTGIVEDINYQYFDKHNSVYAKAAGKNDKPDNIVKLTKIDQQLATALDLWDNTYNSSPEAKIKKNFITIIDAYREYRDTFGAKFLPPLKVDHMDHAYDKCKGKKISAKTESDFETAKKVVDYWKFTQSNFDAALKSKHEICVLGEYVAVKYDDYDKQLKQYFMPNAKATSSYNDDEEEDYDYD